MRASHRRSAALLTASVALATSARASDPSRQDAEAALLAPFEPGFERIVLAPGGLVRARVLERPGDREAVLQREDGLKLVVPDGAIALVVAPQDPFPGPPQPEETRIFLLDGRAVRGVILARTPDGVLARTEEGTVFLAGVRHLIGPSPPVVIGPALVVPAPHAPAVAGRVVLRNGNVLAGEIIARNDDAVLVDVEGLGRVAVLAGAVREVVAASEQRLPEPTHRAPWFVDAAQARYLTVPSGFRLHRGEVVLTQALATTTVAGGLTDHVALSIGAVWPVLYAEPAGWNVIATASGGIDLARWAHVSAGLTGYAASAGGAAFLYGVATLGTPDLSVSAYVGPPAPGAHAAGGFGDRVLAISGAARLGYGLSLVTESWIGRMDGTTSGAEALAVRFVHRGLALELGAFHARDASAPVLPWIAFSTGLSLRREVLP